MLIEIEKGKNIHYKKCGSGKSLIMVHGNGEDLTIFDESVEKLKNYFTVYAIDSSGHGKSYSLNEYHYDLMASDIYKFIKALGIENPIFYGFSDGGILGLMLASKYPTLFSALIVSGANLNPKGLKNVSYLGMKIEYVFKKSPLVKMMITEPNISADDLHKITCDTYILAGSNDVISKKHTKYIADNIKNSHLMILDKESHGSYIVHSTKIANIIIDIINR